jgi:hypothetical protein
MTRRPHIGMPQGIAASVCAALVLCACANPAPPIAQGLPKSFGPTPEFDTRIKERFAVGSDEGQMIAELHAEKFTIEEIHDLSSQYRRSAHYESAEFPCKETWTVRWIAEQGRISGIEGRYSGQLCL